MSEKKREHRRRRAGNSKDECIVCFQSKQKNGNLLSLFWDEDYLCRSCRNKLTVVNRTLEIEGVSCEVIYLYDDEFSHLLLQYKELYDEALYPISLYPFLNRINRKYGNYTLVPVPSTEINLHLRGFDHVAKMFSETVLKQALLFEKDESVDQKNNSMEERKLVGDYIHLKEGIRIPQTPILLADDVITSGESMKACLRLLKDHPYPVKALAVSAGKRWFER